LLGYVHHQGETVRDDAGAPVVYADLLVSLDESAPVREGHYEQRETGQTYRQVWEDLDSQGKTAQLAKSGVAFAAGIQIDGRWSKYNAGAFHFKIQTPEGWPMPEIVELTRR
jgi:hypothetical protein